MDFFFGGGGVGIGIGMHYKYFSAVKKFKPCTTFENILNIDVKY